MDNLLIVRMSDRSRERFSRKRRKLDAPVGMNFGLIAGVGIGVVIAPKFGFSPMVGLGVGVALGIVLGGIAGRFFKPKRRYQRVGTSTSYTYDGIPFENDSEEDEEAGDEVSPRTE